MRRHAGAVGRRGNGRNTVSFRIRGLLYLLLCITSYIYMKILSNENNPVHLGLLVCEHLYIYYYDFTKSDEENDKNKLEIRFTKDNPDGEKFVELFSKENFDEEKIRDFIQSRKRQKNMVSEIQNKLTGTFICEAVKDYLKKHGYKDYDIEKSMEGFLFECKQKTFATTMPDLKNNDLDKEQIKDLCGKNNVDIPFEFTKAKLNAATPRYWANPNKKNLFKDWWIALVNTDERKLHILKIPANTIKPEDLKYKTSELIDLQIYSDRQGFIDSRSGISFLKYYIKTIDY